MLLNAWEVIKDTSLSFLGSFVLTPIIEGRDRKAKPFNSCLIFLRSPCNFYKFPRVFHNLLYLLKISTRVRSNEGMPDTIASM
jgi:hypothetical protein